MPAVVWFRRDLRLADHPALRRAAEGGPVLGLFVVDPVLFDASGAPRRRALAGCLRELDAAMGGRLAVRVGRPAEVVPAVAAAVGAPEVLASADYGPYGRRRDGAVAAALAADGRALRFVGSPYAVSPGTVVTGSGTPFKVFTPFSKAWRAHGWPPPVDVPEVEWLDRRRAGHDGLPDVADDDRPVLPPMGEHAARERWRAFVAEQLDHYGERRDHPGADATSHLSVDLKYGTVHPRTLLADLGDTAGHRVFRSELAWREFYADVLFHRPESAWTSMNGKVGRLRSDDGPTADERFAAWCAGRTGYPIVDAGMRQLLAEAWVHNRVRMIVASFLVKDLHLPWQRGAAWFMERLVDGDLASNQHGWQWTAGTGTDAAPYFRIFNPVGQGERFDPSGTYVRRYVAELAGVPDAHVHTPWTAPDPPAGYPAPIVDHARERAESLARLAELG